MDRHSRGLSYEAAELALESPFGDFADAIVELTRDFRHLLGTRLNRNALVAVGAIGLLAGRTVRRS